jgi:hypothetical protein
MVFPGIPGVGGVAGFIGGGAILLGLNCGDFTLVNSQTQFLCNTYIGNAPGGTPECSGLLEVYHEARFFCDFNAYENVVVGTDCGHEFRSKGTAHFDCDVTIGLGEVPCLNYLTVNSDSTFNCPVLIFGNCGTTALTVEGDAEFACDVSLTGGCGTTLDVMANANFNCDVVIGDGACGTTLLVTSDTTFECPITIDGSCGTTALTVKGDTTHECPVTIMGSCGTNSLIVGGDAWLKCGVSVGTDCDNDTFHVYCPAYFECDTIFKKDVTVGMSCDDVLVVNSTSTFNCPITINGSCGTNALIVEGDAWLKCGVSVGADCDNDSFHVWCPAYFECDTIFKKDVTVGMSCDDVLVVNSTSTFNCPITFNGTCGTTALTVKGDTTHECPVTIMGSCGTTALTVGGDTTLECSVTIGSGNCAGAEQLNSWVESIFHCNVDIGTLATACDPNFTFNSYHYSNFFCDTTFHESVVIGDSCANDTLTVGATSTFNCPATFTDDVTIGNDCNADILTVNAGSIFTCPTEFTDCVEVANLNVGGALSAQSFYFCGQSDACGGDGLGTLLPCPGGGDEILLNNGGTLTWHGYTEETISVCIDGVMTPKKFLILD